ncbi:HXXEE domain-containing protein [Fictibacillus terranigra]|uniref:HXXEE domain-containing protein n=1 Tax=Fictibacillus terranigra TaxID=3058424 RepID=A0ABT8EAM0_9BACL|nr:HXXEE domain-containing protein [Fictibacillus sp. CENA-BCM004]MDN4074902.1 HXXEE domain-containing protein [Fictibacillus sp. CENA-BCM004]
MREQPLFLLLASTLFMNGVTHALQALYFRGYTPGVVTCEVPGTTFEHFSDIGGFPLF